MAARSAGLIFLTLVVWSFSSPVGSSPDDDFHLASAYCGQGLRAGLCEYSTQSGTRFVPSAVLNSSLCFRGVSKEIPPASCQDIQQVFVDLPLAQTERFNQGGYPPVFYWFSSWFATRNVEASAMAMRLMNSLVIALLLFTALLWVRLDLRRSILIPVVLGGVPLGVYLMASNNPSGWAIMGVTVFWPTLVSVLESRRPSQSLLLIPLALSATMAVGARADSSYFLVVSSGCALIVAQTSVQRKMIFLGLLIPASLFLRGPVDFKAIWSGLFSSGEGQESFSWIFNLLHLPRLVFGVQGFGAPEDGSLNYLGWFDVPIPPITPVLLVPVVFGIHAVGIRRAFSVRGLATAFLWFVLLAIPMWTLTKDALYVGAVIQPRYLLPLFFVVLGFVVADLPGDSILPVPNNLIRAGTVMIVAAHSAALYFTIARYSAGYTEWPGRFGRLGQWWWDGLPNPVFWWLTGSATFGLLAFEVSKLLPTSKLVSSA